MIQEAMQQEILTRIDKLAEKLGVTVEYLWPYLVRYEVGAAVAVFATTAVFTIVSGVLWWVALKWDMEMVGIAAAIVSIVAIVLMIIATVAGIPAIIAPEAAAFKALLP